jgi:branched-chain amino acid transport system substrate-binding protein
MQADALIEEIYNKRKITRVATINDQAYDSNVALKSYLQSLKLAGKNQPISFLFDKDKPDLDVLADQIKKAEVNCIVLFCQPSVCLKIIRLFRQRKMNLPVFGSLAMLNEDALTLQELNELDDRVFIPYATLLGSKSLIFRQDYQKTYGKMPGMVAAYAFDGINVLIEAIRTSGSPEREKIQQALSKIYYEGVTGRIQFDNTGNRMGYSSLTAFKKAMPSGVQ